MSRDFKINGPCMVRVRFGKQVVGNIFGGPAVPEVEAGNVFELGLSVNEIRVCPALSHVGKKADDFGPEICPEELAMGAFCYIRGMLLAHYDPGVMNACIGESMGGVDLATGLTGSLQGAGILMGGNVEPGEFGCHWIGLHLDQPGGAGADADPAGPWFFPTARLTGQPLEIPLGTGLSLITCEWKAIPYRRQDQTLNTPLEIKSRGTPLWQRGVNWQDL